MDVDPDEINELQITRLKSVQRLTELNAHHISSQTRLSGIEIEMVRAQDAIESGNTGEQINSDIDRLNQEYNEVMESRSAIDLERDSLNVRIQEIDNLIGQIIQKN